MGWVTGFLSLKVPASLAATISLHLITALSAIAAPPQTPHPSTSLHHALPACLFLSSRFSPTDTSTF